MFEGKVQALGQIFGNVYFLKDWCHEDFYKQTWKTLSDRSYRGQCVWQISESKSKQKIKVLPFYSVLAL